MKIGFIGAGNMAQAMIKGFAATSENSKESIFVTDIAAEKAKIMCNELSVTFCNTAEDVCLKSETVILAVKPNVYPIILKQLSDFPCIENKLLISIAPGVSHEVLNSYFSRVPSFIRIMPNTPALVGEGMFAICPAATVEKEKLTVIENLFATIGKTDFIPEYLMDAVTGISGCGPAYVFMFMEALADGAVLKGLPRDKAYIYAAQTVLGSAKMMMESGKHPGELKDQVTSPGGVTIEGVRVLEEKGFRSTVMEAVISSAEKSAQMGK